MKLSVDFREQTGKGANHRLRKPSSGLAKNSGVIYGLKEPMNVEMLSDQTLRFINNHLHGSNKMFELEVSKGGKPEIKTVILQEYQVHPVRGGLMHVDFREVNEHSEVVVEVPIQTTGTSKALKMGGVMQMIRHSVKVKAPVSSIPNQLSIDVTELDFGKSLHVQDIQFPPKVLPVLPGGRNYTLVTISAAIKEEVEAQKPAEAVEAPKAAAPAAKGGTPAPAEAQKSGASAAKAPPAKK